MFKRVWNSPTINTWASFFGRTLGAVLVLPLVLCAAAVAAAL